MQRVEQLLACDCELLIRFCPVAVVIVFILFQHVDGVLDVLTSVRYVTIARSLSARTGRQSKRLDRRHGLVCAIGAKSGEQIGVGILHRGDGRGAVTGVVGLILLQHVDAARDVAACVAQVGVTAHGRVNRRERGR